LKRILIVEDDENLSRGITFAFEKDGHFVIQAATLSGGRSALEQQDIDIIILDLGLPDGDGMELCRYVRAQSNIPIVMLTARELETDEVAGLTAGADDYITKPFSLSVLRARVETVIRRLDANNNQMIYSGKYRLDTSLCKLYRGGEEILISTMEFRALKYFMNNAGQILSKEQILAALWDSQGNFVDENTLHVNISRLRAKIEDDPKTPKLLKTVHGMGYVWTKG
jgi:DNA-binding response OmpR family regulator